MDPATQSTSQQARLPKMMISSLWQAETREVKQHYTGRAEEEKEKHRQLYLNYQYQPRTKKAKTPSTQAGRHPPPPPPPMVPSERATKKRKRDEKSTVDNTTLVADGDVRMGSPLPYRPTAGTQEVLNAPARSTLESLQNPVLEYPPEPIAPAGAVLSDDAYRHIDNNGAFMVPPLGLMLQGESPSYQWTVNNV